MLTKRQVEMLRKEAPAIFAVNHAPVGIGGRYTFIRTIEVLDALADVGLIPVKAMQSKVRDELREGFQKHVVRLRRADSKPINGVYPEMGLTNAHDGHCGYRLHAGYHRIICSNGATISFGPQSVISMPHAKLDKDSVVDAAMAIGKQLLRLEETMDEMMHYRMKKAEQVRLAKAALAIRFPNHTEPPIAPDAVLAVRRPEDNHSDLWTVYNRLQEHLTKGGHEFRDTTNRPQRTRLITNIQRDIEINMALFEEARLILHPLTDA